jgi:hypothetical protein
MIVRRSFSLVSVPAASILLGLVTFGQTAAQDVRHLCSEKYQAAKAAGTLNGDTWPQFYSKCTAEAKGNAAAAESAAAPPPPDTRHICSEKYQAAKAGGTLNGETWPQFYSRCTAETKANPPAAVAAPAPVPAPAPAAPAPIVASPPAVEPPAPPVAAAPAEEAPPPVAAPAAPVVAPAPANPLKKAPASNKPVAPAVAAAPSTAVFPSAISPAYAGEKPGRARLRTCLDQYNANKATNANGGLKWIQKGGGYYSECSKRLRG